MKTMRSYSRILNALGTGPKTAKELKAITRREGVQARIAEFNRYYDDIEIGKTDTTPCKYYLVFPSNVKLNTKKLYPNMKLNDYTLRTKKGEKFNG